MKTAVLFSAITLLSGSALAAVAAERKAEKHITTKTVEHHVTSTHVVKTTEIHHTTSTSSHHTTTTETVKHTETSSADKDHKTSSTTSKKDHKTSTTSDKEHKTSTTSSASKATSTASHSGYLLSAVNANSTIDGATINANGGSFWIGKKTLSAHPSNGSYPTGNTTLFEAPTSAGNFYLDTELAQEVYVDSAGALHFTAAGSTASSKSDSKSGFSWNKKSKSNKHSKRASSEEDGFIEHGSADFKACPTNSTAGVYQIYLDINEFSKSNHTGCLSFEIAATFEKGYGAYEYV